LKVNAPIQEQVGQGWTSGWSNFFTQLVQAVGWVKGWSYKFTINFSSVAANSQSPGNSVSITGVRQGDSVHVTPYSETTGITYKGVVTSDDTVTIYAINFTAAAIDPASMQFRVVVIQN
jgi:hypothetical protein